LLTDFSFDFVKLSAVIKELGLYTVPTTQIRNGQELVDGWVLLGKFF